MQYMAEELERSRDHMIRRAQSRFQDATERKEVLKTIVEVYDRTFIALAAACGMSNGGIPSEKRKTLQGWPEKALIAIYPQLG